MSNEIKSIQSMIRELQSTHKRVGKLAKMSKTADKLAFKKLNAAYTHFYDAIGCLKEVA